MVAKEFQIVIFLLNFDGINGKIKEIFFLPNFLRNYEQDNEVLNLLIAMPMNSSN